MSVPSTTPRTPSRSRQLITQGSPRRSPATCSPRRPLRIQTTVLALSDSTSSESPVQITPPQKKKKTNVPSDADLWDYTDEEILAQEKKRLHSEAYAHYTLTIARDATTRALIHIFSCKHDEPKHRPFKRLRSKMHEGTSNLQRAADACDIRRRDFAAAPVQVTEHANTAGSYTVARHRAILALWSATAARPPRMMFDKYHRMEIELLRPGTILPSESTVGRDMKLLHRHIAVQVKNFFQNRGRRIHSSSDGWTNPAASSILDFDVIWHDHGEIYHGVLDFIKLSQSHTGKYIANEVFKLLKSYALEKQLLGWVMDNASNCDTTADEFASINAPHWSESWRIRCLLHIINLMAKAAEKLFEKTYKRKKTVKSSKGTKRRRSGQHSATATAQSCSEDVLDAEAEFTMEPGNTDDPLELQLADTQAADAEESGNQPESPTPEQVAHDEGLVKTLKDVAIAQMLALGVAIDPDEATSALKIIPKIAGLARKLHENTTLGDAFERQVISDPSIHHGILRLIRRVATRWNADLECLRTHNKLANAVQAFTGQDTHGCDAFRLSSSQWELARDLENLLGLFEPLTKKFSAADTPLIADVLEDLHRLRVKLVKVRDTTHIPVKDGSPRRNPEVIRVAAHAAILVHDKYIPKLHHCEIYAISIAMSPDKKLKWFSEHGYSEVEVNKIREMTRRRWCQDYKSTAQSSITPSGAVVAPPALIQHCSPWDDDDEPLEPLAEKVDDIDVYFDEPVVPKMSVKTAGGAMKWWYAQESLRPSVALMAMDFISAPASSISSERQFSTGRRSMNWMQHGMSHDVLRARMTLGSWDGTPLFPRFETAAEIIEQQMRSSTP